MTKMQDTAMYEQLQGALIDRPDFLKGVIESILQKILEQQFEAHIGVPKYERCEDRQGYRNGFYQRQLKTRVGTIQLSVCRDRAGTFQTDLFNRYERSEKALVLGIAEMYLKGISTRKVEGIADLTELFGFSISKSQVSELTKTLDEELEARRNRSLEREYKYLFVDALVHKSEPDIYRNCQVGVDCQVKECLGQNHGKECYVDFYKKSWNNDFPNNLIFF